MRANTGAALGRWGTTVGDFATTLRQAATAYQRQEQANAVTIDATTAAELSICPKTLPQPPRIYWAGHHGTADTRFDP
ncbi:hypothetical protein AB0L57_30430 [Nocardia sp. NPDC052254]|uniref:hypothetical protein n=1 Tax=Nocardia sp. NPDC052254 TaxID=3155681 RepID=UPI00341F505D